MSAEEELLEEEIVLDTFKLTKDFIQTSGKNLKANVVRGPFESLNEYLEIQRCLIMEDFFNPLRKGILDIERNKSSPKEVHSYGKAIINNCTYHR